jgi:DNA-binding GntR family transcriptional regulator
MIDPTRNSVSGIPNSVHVKGKEGGTLLDSAELHTDPLYIKVYTLLKNRILTGRLPPGGRLRETALAADLGVSRTPVRDALRRLEQDGLIVPAAGSAYEVFSPSRADMLHVYEARAAIEGGAARIAATRGAPAACADMEQVLTAMRRAYASHDSPGLIELDTGFHELLVAASGNPVLEELHTRLRTRLGQMRSASGDVTERGPEILEQHGAIIRALRTRNPETAEAAARAHIEFVCSRALEAFVTQSET